MKYIVREHRRAAWLRYIGRPGAALVALCLLFQASTATAALEPAAFPGGDRPRAFEAQRFDMGTDRATAIGVANDERIELAQGRGGGRDRGGNADKPPERGSSAQLEGGSSADRYGGSSADRRGVAGRYDTRNRGVRQFQASDRRRDRERPKSDELQDQDDDPPRDRYSFQPPDPFQGRDRGGRD